MVAELGSPNQGHGVEAEIVDSSSIVRYDVESSTI